MERLTNADYEEMGFFAYAGPKNPYSVPLTIGELAELPNIKYSPREILEEVFARLAAYEDTGLEPEEVKRLQEYMKPFTIQDMDRFREIMDAEKDGRLVVLPCKVGDTVYFASWFGTGPHIVERVIDPYFYTKDARDMGSTADFLLKDFGKIVFHTRKEAEEALRKEADNG